MTSGLSCVIFNRSRAVDAKAAQRYSSRGEVDDAQVARLARVSDNHGALQTDPDCSRLVARRGINAGRQRASGSHY